MTTVRSFSERHKLPHARGTESITRTSVACRLHMSGQYRHQCFTYWKPDDGELPSPDEFIESFKDARVRFVIFQLEKGKKSGRLHYQGYAEFTTTMRMAALQKLAPKAHWKARRGTAQQAADYCRKDDTKVDGPWEYGDMSRPGTRSDRINVHAVHAAAMAAATVHEALQIIKEGAPRDYHLHGSSIESNMRKHRKEIAVPKYGLDKFSLDPLNFDEKKAALLTGTTSYGKTNYAMAHFKRPLLATHIDDLKDLTPDNDGIVFDDMSFLHWPLESIIHLMPRDYDSRVNVRYSTVHVPYNIPKIFVSNKGNPFFKSSPPLDSTPDQIVDWNKQVDAIKTRYNEYEILEDIRKQ